jgi:predicted CopG family antitoxin
MAKLIAVTEVVYTRLRKIKGKQSFSAAIDKLIESRSCNMGKYFGVWRSRNDLDRIEKEITASRRETGLRRAKALDGV